MVRLSSSFLQGHLKGIALMCTRRHCVECPLQAGCSSVYRGGQHRQALGHVADPPGREGSRSRQGAVAAGQVALGGEVEKHPLEE